MAGIPVHTTSPINVNTQVSSPHEPARVEASTTTPAVSSSQTARPGAPAMPAPTGAAQRYAPPSPTRTTAAPADTGPPPPQPGQLPQPFQERGRTIPPAPEPASYNTKTTNYTPPTSESPSSWTPSYRVARPKGQDLSHPPGYVQNHHASFDDRDMDGGNMSHTPSPTRVGRGILDREPTMKDMEEESSPLWDTAMNLVKEAGRKLSVAEGEVWKKINGEK